MGRLAKNAELLAARPAGRRAAAAIGPAGGGRVGGRRQSGRAGGNRAGRAAIGPKPGRARAAGMLVDMPEPISDELADAELAAYLAAIQAEQSPSARQLGVATVRQAQRLRVLAAAPGPRLAAVEDLTAGQRPVPVRWYRPVLEPRPLVVFLHGGMWVIGDLDSHDRTCRRLAAQAGVAVLAVDFRLAPEHKWPAAVDDAVDVLRWAVSAAAGTATAGDAETGQAVTGQVAAESGEAGLAEAVQAAGSVAVAGDSSGGNLAALACLRLRDEGGPQPAAQILVTPNTDLTLSQPSAREKATGWGLDSDDVAWGAELWLPGLAMLAGPEASPLHAADLAGLPPAVVVTAEQDPLRDEGDAYAARLADAGVRVLHRSEAGMIHGFLSMERISPAAAAAGDRLFADVARLMGTGVASDPAASSGSAGRT